MKSNKATVILEVLVVAGVVALFGLVGKVLFHKDTKNAKASEKATTELTGALSDKQTSDDARGASAAASATVINEAVQAGPDSPAKTFVGRETPLLLSYLPAPDYQRLLEAEKRKNAVLEGETKLADKLYKVANADSLKLAEENGKLKAQVADGLEYRRKVDGDLLQAAAVDRYKTIQSYVLGVIAALFGLGWIYAKINGLGFKTLGLMKADFESGHSATEVFDRYIPLRGHKVVRRAKAIAKSESDI